ncbi:MAG: FeoB-associated Cys-rich membrane protein [Clostridia bacterium]|nr:FeoB-associated Cys-rich membrane protein [Clostridia bacterium]
MWETLAVIGIVLLIIGGALAYVIRSKRRGVKCVGCPHAKECGSCHCHCSNKAEE